MDTPILISMIVLTVIAAIELFCLFLCKEAPDRPPLVVVIPVFGDIELLEASLERVRGLMLRGSCTVDRIILIDYNADVSSSTICNEFCRDFKEAVFIKPEEMKNFLAETFAFEAKM